jgi:hypothetical protein
MFGEMSAAKAAVQALDGREVRPPQNITLCCLVLRSWPGWKTNHLPESICTRVLLPCAAHACR